MALDISRLRADIHDIVSQIRETKAPLRTRWTAPMYEHQARLISLKDKATRLCILRAHARGKVHLAGDADTCRKIAEQLAPTYAKEDAAA